MWVKSYSLVNLCNWLEIHFAIYTILEILNWLLIWNRYMNGQSHLKTPFSRHHLFARSALIENHLFNHSTLI